jgi:hypothetical protein
MGTYKSLLGCWLKIFNPQNEKEEIKHLKKDDNNLQKKTTIKILKK